MPGDLGRRFIMKIWEVKHQISPDVALIAYKRMEDIDPTLFFRGEKLGGSWKVPAAQLNPAQPGARVVDFPFFEYGALLCRTTTWGILKPFLELEVELLPVDVEGFSYQVLNPIQVIDCLDKERSQMTFSKTGRVMSIEHHVFNEEVLSGVYLFKTPELISTRVYATEALREIIAKNRMEGLEFRGLA